MIALKIIYFILAILFCLKIFIDLLSAYIEVWELYKTDDDRTKGFSIMPVEILLLIIMIVLSIFIKEDGIFYQPFYLAGYGMLVIFLSYFHLVFIGFVGGWIVSIINKQEKEIDK